MPSVLTISGPTFTQSIAKALPVIPAVQGLYFFGTGGDGNNGNRVAGGPAPTIKEGNPVYSTNYVTVGNNIAGARHDAIETNIATRTAPVLASGWSYAAVARSLGSGPGQSATITSENNSTTAGASPTIWMVGTTGNRVYMNEAGTRITLITTIPTSTWHFVAMTYSGGASGTWTLYSFTENPTTGAPVTYAQTGYASGTAQSVHFGALSTETPTDWAADLAFGMVSYSVLNAALLSQLAASVKSFLARRGLIVQ